METLLRFLSRPVHLKPAGPRARRVLWLLLVGWVVLNVADWSTTAALLVRGGVHEDNPLQAALLAHGGMAVTWLGFRLWPRVFVALMVVCELLVAAVIWNTRLLILR